MNRNSLMVRLQSLLGFSKAEVSFVVLFASGLLLASIINVTYNRESDNIDNQAINMILDSLAESNKTTYTGTDVRNNPLAELKQGDTLIRNESQYPQRKAKELPKGKININTASKIQLMQLPGVGESTALKIIEARNQRPFPSAENITRIKGIGPKKYEKMKPYIEVK